MPKVDYTSLTPLKRDGYPGQLKKITEGYERLTVGEAVGLTQFGVNRVTVQPGAATALRHWHEREDEFVIIVSGTVALIDDDGETVLKAGDCAGFKAGDANGHHIVNRSSSPAVLFEIGTRSDTEICDYPDEDLLLHIKRQSGSVESRFTRRDGTPVTD